MIVRIFVQFFITLLAIPLMGGILSGFTKGVTFGSAAELLILAVFVVVLLWASNFLGRMDNEEWKAKFEREWKMVQKYLFVPLAALTIIKFLVVMAVKLNG